MGRKREQMIERKRGTVEDGKEETPLVNAEGRLESRERRLENGFKK